MPAAPDAGRAPTTEVVPPSVAGGQRFAERLRGEGAGDDLSDVLAEQMTGFASGEQVAGGELDDLLVVEQEPQQDRPGFDFRVITKTLGPRPAGRSQDERG